MSEQDEIYEDEVERQWGEASSIRGISPDMLDARHRPHPTQEPTEEPAAFSPLLIPFGAILAGPLVAALLTLLADGEPPTGRQAVVIISTGITAWVINVGMTSIKTPFWSPGMEAGLKLGVLVVVGLLLWAMYRLWMKGKRRLDQRALIQSAVILFALSALFWFGRTTSWWLWLGR